MTKNIESSEYYARYNQYRRKAQQTLSHYITTCLEETGLEVGYDTHVEIDQAVEDIVQAAFNYVLANLMTSPAVQMPPYTEDPDNIVEKRSWGLHHSGTWVVICDDMLQIVYEDGVIDVPDIEVIDGKTIRVHYKYPDRITSPLALLVHIGAQEATGHYTASSVHGEIEDGEF